VFHSASVHEAGNSNAPCSRRRRPCGFGSAGRTADGQGRLRNTWGLCWSTPHVAWIVGSQRVEATVMGVIDTTKRHYQRFFERDGDLDHPADNLVNEMPEVRAADQAAQAISVELCGSDMALRAAERWVEYEDARFHQRALHEERFFDVGYEMGRLAGLAESRDAGWGVEVESLGRQVHEVVVASQLPPARVAAVLLDAARALVLGASGTETRRD
jgi:hypothetical protein